MYAHCHITQRFSFLLARPLPCLSNVLLHAPHVGSKKKVPKFAVDDLEGTLHFIPDHELDKHGKPTATVRQYVVGFTLVPPWIMHGGLARFVAVDSLDAAGQRGRSSGPRPRP